MDIFLHYVPPRAANYLAVDSQWNLDRSLQ